MTGVTASAAGAIGGAAFVPGKRALIDLPTAAIALITLAALLKLKKALEPIVILVAGVGGHRHHGSPLSARFRLPKYGTLTDDGSVADALASSLELPSIARHQDESR